VEIPVVKEVYNCVAILKAVLLAFDLNHQGIVVILCYSDVVFVIYHSLLFYFPFISIEF
jgi:hypothetical protein